MVSGQWAVVRGPWAVGRGPWAVGRGQGVCPVLEVIAPLGRVGIGVIAVVLLQQVQQQLCFVAEFLQFSLSGDGDERGQSAACDHADDGELHGTGEPEDSLQVMVELCGDVGDVSERKYFFGAAAVVDHHQQRLKGDGFIGIKRCSEDAAGLASPVVECANVCPQVFI